MEGRDTTDETTVRASEALGDYGERLAARHLGAAGLEVLARNWRCELGEIDLVLREGTTLVVCEVEQPRDTLTVHIVRRSDEQGKALEWFWERLSQPDLYQDWLEREQPTD